MFRFLYAVLNFIFLALAAISPYFCVIITSLYLESLISSSWYFLMLGGVAVYLILFFAKTIYFIEKEKASFCH